MLKCGFYEAETTPFLGAHITGYYRTRVAEGVKTKLYAKALALQCDDNKPVVILGFDGISTTQELFDGVHKRINQFTELSPEQIMIGATHCHTSAQYRKSDEFNKNDPLYTEFLTMRLADCAVLALQRMEEATAWYGCEKVEGIAFIRNYLMKDGSIRTNPGRLNPDIVKPIGEVDDDYPFIIFKNSEGKMMGALSSYAVHSDTVAGNEYCGDYSGVLSDELKKAFGNDFVSLFLIGFCGNINHVNTKILAKDQPKPVWEHIGKKLAKAITENLDSLEELDVSALGFSKKYISVPKRQVSEAEIEHAKELLKQDGFDFEKVNIANPDSELFKRANAEKIIKYAEEEMKTPALPVIQVISIGDCLVYAMNGECYVEFQHYIKENSPSKKNLFASNSNGGVIGYVPVKEMTEVPTLYEANLPSAVMVPGSSEMLVDELVEMAKTLI